MSTAADLLDEVEAFVSRFVALPSAHARAAVTLWVAHAHAVTCFENTPRLAFLSPEPGSGKTRALEIVELLVPNPLLTVNASPAYVIRKIAVPPEELPTLLFDEIDTVFGPKAKDNEELRGVLNSGYRKGAVAGRCVIRGKSVETEELPSFCAVALAGLGNLPATIMTRSVVIRMRRRTRNEAVEPYRRRCHAEEGQRLNDRLRGWAGHVSPRLTQAWPALPDGIADRNADVWEPLLAVADAAGGHWPRRARAAALALVGEACDSAQSRGVRLLADIRSIFEDRTSIPTDLLLVELAKLDEAPWGDIRGKPIDAPMLARMLRPYEVRPVQISGINRKGYRRSDFDDPWSRYLGGEIETPTPTRNSRNPEICAGCGQPLSVVDLQEHRPKHACCEFRPGAA